MLPTCSRDLKERSNWRAKDRLPDACPSFTIRPSRLLLQCQSGIWVTLTIEDSIVGHGDVKTPRVVAAAGLESTHVERGPDVKRL